ncbi:hypothetical protein, partial [Bradyrhizobium sp. NBAIM08]|uniref:hypothetical protein n=1 Tax=Bradyrhizobium sp. NBAIM08 TaxID=2793815 RepID=UPI001CD7EF17
HVDTIGIIAGVTPVRPAQLMAPATPVTNPPLQIAVDQLPADEQYSYSFNGDAQAIDHALLSTAAQSVLSSFTFSRGNNDAPAEYDESPFLEGFGDGYEDTPRAPIRVSDHDGFVLRLFAP